jgi:hypothetical protein
MGMGTRIFLVDDDDSLERLSLARFERLLRGDPEEQLPLYAGKRIRYALVVLEVEQRRPVAINYIQYAFLHFDSKGRLEVSEREREARTVVEMFSAVDEKSHHLRVIDARFKFARKRYADKYKWTPNPKIEAKLMEALFGK